jgi:glycosyltransferase involved in cell wall biosynthesis
MTATFLQPAPPASAPAPAIDVVLPVHNEEVDLEPSVRRLVAHLRERFPFPVRVTIADNASTDATWTIAQQLADELPGVRACHLDRKGRGLALKQTWSASEAAVLVYMDVDLSTDLAALLPLVAPLLSGHSDLAIGTRLARSARVVRSPKRELISRCYNLVLHVTLTTGFSDAQCGFKAIRADRARQLLPLVEDEGWFFDTELLVLAERAGLRIHEVPVDWNDDPDSRVDIVSTALGDLRGVARLLAGILRGSLPLPELRDASRRTDRGLVQQAVSFGAIGSALVAANLAATALRFLALRGWVFRPRPVTRSLA